MQKYLVSITETLNRIVEVEAKTDREALNKVIEQYDRGEIILTPEDYFDVDYEVKLNDGKGF